MKKSVYDFEQKVRAIWEDKESMSAYPFGRHYGGTLTKPFAIDENNIIYIVHYGRVERKYYKSIFNYVVCFGREYCDDVEEMGISLLFEYNFKTGEEHIVYEALDMTKGYPSRTTPKYKTQMRIFRNKEGSLFIKLTDVKPGWGIRDEVYILQPMRYVVCPDEKNLKKKEVCIPSDWHKIYADGMYSDYVRGVHYFGKQVDDQTVFDTIENMTFDFNDPYRVPHPQ